tara:strand:- start:3046 stop:3255 length:210 start_codon:yes stop_codon:yes gene_type:complete
MEVMVKFKEPKEFYTREYKLAHDVTQIWHYEKGTKVLFKITTDYPKWLTSVEEDILIKKAKKKANKNKL